MILRDFVVVLAWVSIATSNKRVRLTKMGPYKVEFVRAEDCPNKDPSKYVLYRAPTRAYKYNHTTTIYRANLTLMRDFADDFTTYFDISIWGNGGWRPNFYKVSIPGGCKKLFEFEGKLFQHMMNTNLSCPIKKGTLLQPNYDTNRLTTEKNHVRNMYYGEYKLEASFIYGNGEVGTCMVFIVKLTQLM